MTILGLGEVARRPTSHGDGEERIRTMIGDPKIFPRNQRVPGDPD
jgi:hypothetical protein